MIEETGLSAAVFETIDALIVGFGPQGRITYFNRACEELTGYSRDEVVGRVFWEFLLPERCVESARQWFGDVVSGKKPPGQFECSWIAKDGDERLIAWRDSATTGVQGKVTQVLTTGMDITESKRTEEALQASEERLRIIFEFAPDAYYLSDLQGHFLDGNKAAEERVGYGRQELIGKSFLRLNLLPPGQIPKAAALLAKNAVGQPTGPDEFTLIRKDGTRVEVEIRTYPVRIAGRALVLGIARDVTERKRAQEALRQVRDELEQRVEERTEELAKSNEQLRREVAERELAQAALRESEELYRGLEELSGMAIVRLDREGRRTFVNDHALRMYGRSREEFLKGRYGDQIVPEDREAMEEAIKEATEKGETVFGSISRQMVRGQVRHMSSNWMPIRDVQGKVTGMQTTTTDITDQVEMEERLRQSEAFFRGVTENVTDLIWTMDMGLRFTYLSPSVTPSLGYEVEEAMALSLEQMLTPDSFELAMKTLGEELAIEGMEEKDLSRSRTLDLELICEDGSTIWTETRMTFLRDSSGQAVGILGVTRDITERSRLEQMKAEFLSAVSHDFVTPLTSLQTSVDLLQESSKDTLDEDLANQLLANMGRSLERLEKLISDLMDISALRNATLKLSSEEVEASSVIASAAAVVSPLVRDKGQTLDVQVEPSLPMVLVDGHRVEQVLVNLLSNAHKFSPRGATITLKVGRDQSRLLFEVSDNGPGIPNVEQERVFEAFYRVPDVATQRTAGSGIGLSIAKHLVELHGGSIWVKSKAGEGSSFFFTLPLQDPGEADGGR